MRAGRRPPRSNATAADRGKPPVVVTFDAVGCVADMVGDIGIFVGEDTSTDEVLRRLLDLTEGEGAPAETLNAVELSDGHFADIHILFEGDQRHFVLLDTSDIAQSLRQNQQANNEAALAQEREQQRLRRASRDSDGGVRSTLDPFRRSAGLFATIANEMRESMTLLSGHARLLARQCKDDPVAMRSVAAIQHAAVRLDVLSSNGLIRLGELAKVGERSGVVDVHQLAAFMQDAFSLQAESRGIGFEVQVPERSILVEADDLAFRQLLINLLVRALDGMEEGDLVLSMSTTGKRLEVELEAIPHGFTAERFGALITTGELLRSHSAGSLALAVSQQILRRMKAVIELVPRKDGGYALWFRIPVSRAGTEEGRLLLSEEKTEAGWSGYRAVAVAVEETSIAQRIIELLVWLGVPAVGSNDMSRLDELAREGALRALVLADRFRGQDSAELLRRWATTPGVNALVIEDAPLGVDAGWRVDRNVIRIAANADRESLKEALSAMLAL